MKNFYATLGLKFGASDEDIKRNYRTLAKRYHPDVNPSDANVRRFADINEAYDTLSDPDKRKAYDAEFVAAAQKAAARKAAQSATGYSSEQIIAAMQQEARINEQIHAQVEAQLMGVKQRAFAEGYEKGKAYGKEVSKQMYGKEAVLHKSKADEYARDRADLEEELFERDRELNKANGRIKELEAQIGWFRRAAGGGNQITGLFAERLEEDASRAKELKAEIDKLAVHGINATSNPSLKLDKQKRMKTDIDEVDMRIASLTRELNEWQAEVRRREQAAAADKSVSEAEKKAKLWAEKQKADTAAAKPTLYGTLGVLIWATDEEINAAYGKLKAHYAEKDDGAAASKLLNLKQAYATLSDPKKRSEYNRSIGISDARIESERALIRENAQAQAAYGSSLAEKSFWVRFDELTALALSGDADAQNALGEIYYSGDKTERDYVQAVYWFREAVKEKHPAAVFNLGMCYLSGNGVNKNRSIGLAFLRQANNLGYKGK